LTLRSAQPNLETFRYRNSFRLYIEPELGPKRIAAITVDDVAKLIARLERQGLSGWTIRGA
jgi:hypothetical protein